MDVIWSSIILKKISSKKLKILQKEKEFLLFMMGLEKKLLKTLLLV